MLPNVQSFPFLACNKMNDNSDAVHMYIEMLNV